MMDILKGSQIVFVAMNMNTLGKSLVRFYFILSLPALILAFNGNGNGFEDTNSVDSGGAPAVPEEFFEKTFTYAPYVDILRNMTYLELKKFISDLIAWEEPLELKKKFPYYISGYDFEDRPIMVIEFGHFKIREVLEQGPRGAEILERYIQKAGVNGLLSMTPGKNSTRKDVRDLSAILDIDGFQYSQGIHMPTLNFARKITGRYGALLNVAVDKVVIVNANFIGETFFQLIRPFLGQLLERVDLYGTKKSKWMPKLRRAFPEVSIPPKYGGRTDFQPIRSYG